MGVQLGRRGRQFAPSLAGVLALLVGGFARPPCAVAASADAGLALASVTPAPADAYLVRNWQAVDGLPQNTVKALAQTADGYLWLGT
jgi:uncharacterized protein (DUF2147 family)